MRNTELARALVSDRELLILVTGEDERKRAYDALLDKVANKMLLESAAFFGVVLALWSAKNFLF